MGGAGRWYAEAQVAKEGLSMSVRLYLTIAAVVAILYALAFLIIPVQASLFFSDFAEARAVLYLRFCGAGVLAWGLIVWFARDFREWYPIRAVLIGSVAGLAECQRLGINGRALLAITRRNLSPLERRIGAALTSLGGRSAGPKIASLRARRAIVSRQMVPPKMNCTLAINIRLELSIGFRVPSNQVR